MEWKLWSEEQPDRLTMYSPDDDTPNGEISPNILVIVEEEDGDQFGIIVAYYHYSEETWVAVEWDGNGESGQDMDLNVRYWAPLPEVPADVISRLT